jgi:hypothetical protein
VLLPAKLLWDFAHQLGTGVIVAELRSLRAQPIRIELFRGWVHAIDWFPLKWIVGPAPSGGEEQLRVLLTRDDVALRLDDKLPPQKRGAVKPFHPAATIRNAVVVDGAAFRARVADRTLGLRGAPHSSCIGLDERSIISALATPRTLDQLDALGSCTRERIARLCAFLDAMEILVVGASLSAASAYALLELPDGAPVEEVKRAYRRLARALHPDAHPTASPDELRELERRFTEVSAAYRRLAV